jgi:hypothetical protein
MNVNRSELFKVDDAIVQKMERNSETEVFQHRAKIAELEAKVITLCLV